jgi:hypothetical protein
MSRTIRRLTGRNCGCTARARRASAPCRADQRGLDVAGELQLLHGDRDGLLDLGQQALIAGAGYLLVHGFQCHGLALRFGQPRFQHTDLGLQRSDRVSWLCRASARPSLAIEFRLRPAAWPAPVAVAGNLHAGIHPLRE